jgi:hypothetical protein
MVTAAPARQMARARAGTILAWNHILNNKTSTFERMDLKGIAGPAASCIYP